MAACTPPGSEKTLAVARTASKPSSVDLCRAAIDRALKNSDTLRYLLDAVADLGGTTLDRIKCISKDDAFAGAQAGYVWERTSKDVVRGDIVILADDLPHGNEAAVDLLVERNLRHELIHAFDDARGEVDPTDCDHHACSEIRAARLSGDCFWHTGDVSSHVKGDVGLYCVESRAISAVDLNPVCKGYAQRSVDRMFSKCYKDYQPFVHPLYQTGNFVPVKPEWKTR